MEREDFERGERADSSGDCAVQSVVAQLKELECMQLTDSVRHGSSEPIVVECEPREILQKRNGTRYTSAAYSNTRANASERFVPERFVPWRAT